MGDAVGYHPFLLKGKHTLTINLTDKVALVTGSARRVGKKIAIALAQKGVHILIHYNRADDDTLRDTLQDIKSHGVQAFAIQADISQPEGITEIMDALKEHFGRVDILVNSASAFPSGHLLDVTLDSWELTMNVNLRAPFLLTQQCARLMQENDPSGGSIVNIVDQGATMPWPRRPIHGVSKAGLWMLTQVSAVILAPAIRVNAILPGPVMKSSDGMSDEVWAHLGDNLPMRRTGKGEDVAEAVIFLAEQDYITGGLIHVNGGEHLTYPNHSLPNPNN